MTSAREWLDYVLVNLSENLIAESIYIIIIFGQV